MVRSVGTSQIRQHPRILLLRRQGSHLARAIEHLAENLRSRPTQRIRQPRLVGAARSGLPPRMRLLGWQRLSARVQGQRLDTPDLPGVWERRQQCVMGTCCGTRTGCQREWESSRRRETLRHWRQRLPGQAVGV